MLYRSGRGGNGSMIGPPEATPEQANIVARTAKHSPTPAPVECES
jgi:hypothetical protein